MLYGGRIHHTVKVSLQTKTVYWKLLVLRHLPHVVVIRFSFCQRQRIEHIRLARGQDGRPVGEMGPAVRTIEQLRTAPVDPITPFHRVLPHLVPLDLATKLVELSHDPLMHVLLQILARQLVGPVVLVAVPPIEQRCGHRCPALSSGPVEKVLHRLLATRHIARLRLVRIPLQLLLDGPRPEVLRSPLQVPEILRVVHVAHLLRAQGHAERKRMVLKHKSYVAIVN
mmetsp:Transcript_31019/g.70068  ORF Transcript_31019/g.70068 Transcript_31019/m.70068 type:complete len:226 (-) Transcript_31019:1510-2187(-)